MRCVLSLIFFSSLPHFNASPHAMCAPTGKIVWLLATSGQYPHGFRAIADEWGPIDNGAACSVHERQRHKTTKHTSGDNQLLGNMSRRNMIAERLRFCLLDTAGLGKNCRKTPRNSIDNRTFEESWLLTNDLNRSDLQSKQEQLVNKQCSNNINNARTAPFAHTNNCQSPHKFVRLLKFAIFFAPSIPEHGNARQQNCNDNLLILVRSATVALIGSPFRCCFCCCCVGFGERWCRSWPDGCVYSEEFPAKGNAKECALAPLAKMRTKLCVCV